MKSFKSSRNVALFMLIVLLSFFICPDSFADKDKKKKKKGNEVVEQSVQDYGKTVSLITTGTGTTKENATSNALRTAIEKTFGTFVSANTSVVNDDLVKDEIVTVTSGNVASYEELSCRQVNGNDGIIYEVTVQAVVSIDNLVKFAQNHGMSAELSGQTFAMNVKLEALNTMNENEALAHLIIQLYEIAKLGLYDFKIDVKEPSMQEGKAVVEAYVIPVPNANYKAYVELAKKTVSKLSNMSSGKYSVGWKDQQISERSGKVGKKDFFTQGEGNYRLRNNVNEFHRADNELYEIKDGANFIYYYERFKYLSNFAFAIQDNLGNRIETKQNLDGLPNYVPIYGSYGGKRMMSHGNPSEYQQGYYKDKFEPNDLKGNFKPRIHGQKIGKYILRQYAGHDLVCGIFELPYDFSDISRLSKIEVVPMSINLLDNEILMGFIKRTVSPDDILDEAKKFYNLAEKDSGKEKIRYLNMADDLYYIVEKFASDNYDKSDIKNMRSQIGSILRNTL